MNPYIIAGSWFAGGVIVGLGINYTITYYLRKSDLINEAIEGKSLIKEKHYRSTLDKILSFGQDLAEKRFKAGKFEKIVEKYS